MPGIDVCSWLRHEVDRQWKAMSKMNIDSSLHGSLDSNTETLCGPSWETFPSKHFSKPQLGQQNTLFLAESSPSFSLHWVPWPIPYLWTARSHSHTVLTLAHACSGVTGDRCLSDMDSTVLTEVFFAEPSPAPHHCNRVLVSVCALGFSQSPEIRVHRFGSGTRTARPRFFLSTLKDSGL